MDLRIKKSMDEKVPPSESTVSSPLQASSTENMDTSTSGISVEEKFKIIKSIGEECMQEDELMNLLTEKPVPICYVGVEFSGRMDIAQGLLKAINVNKLTSAGCHVKIWIADWFAPLNDKFSGDLKKTRVVGEYMIEVWKAVGMKMEGVEFLWSFEEINSRPHEYFPLMTDIARMNNLERMRSCYPHADHKGGENELTAAQIFYPCMQCADILFLKADICLVRMGQEKLNVLPREYCDKIKRKNKPIILSLYVLPGLVAAGQEKMSKSEPASAIFMEDEEADVNVKIKKAYCPPKVVKDNLCMKYIKYIVLPWLNEFKVERSAENGGEKTYHNYDDVVTDYESGLLHPADLKPALSKAINQILKPVRDHFKEDARAKDLLKRVKRFK